MPLSQRKRNVEKDITHELCSTLFSVQFFYLNYSPTLIAPPIFQNKTLNSLHPFSIIFKILFCGDTIPCTPLKL